MSALSKPMRFEMKDQRWRSVDNERLRIAVQQRRIQRAQRRARRYLKSGTSLIDELLAEGRDARKDA
jgi:hypothetical protein